MQTSIRLTDSPDEADKDAILLPLVQFNEAKASIKTNYRPLAILISDQDTRQVVGGLWGETYFDMLYVDLLFIPKELRHAGLGKQLLLQAEQEAIDRHCNGVWLDTFAWQARGFYEKLGYKVFGTLHDYPAGFDRYFLTKKLSSAD